MPVEYQCDHCGRRLQVSVRLVGRRIACPHCRRPVTVPGSLTQQLSAGESKKEASTTAGVEPSKNTASPPAIAASLPPVDQPALAEERGAVGAPPGHRQPPSPPAGDSPEPVAASERQPSLPSNPAPPLVSIRVPPPFDPSLHVEPTAQSQSCTEPLGGSNRASPPAVWEGPVVGGHAIYPTMPSKVQPPRGVFVPASVVVMQGLLLAVMAVAGIAVGWLLAERHRLLRVPQPSFLTGTVHVTLADGSQQADDRAIVLLLPEKERPERGSRVPVSHLLQSAGSQEDASIVELVRAWGGDLCRVESGGFYYLRAKDAGIYYVLFLSSRARSEAKPLDRQILAELGRYVDRPHELLGARRFAWHKIPLVADRRLDVTLTD